MGMAPVLLTCFAALLISRINSWVSWFIFKLQKNKRVSHAPNTQNGNSAYSVIQSNKQYNEFVVSHSDVLEQLVLTAPREYVHLRLAHGITGLLFHMAWLCHPPPTPLAWLGFLVLACPDANLSIPGRSHKSQIQVFLQLSHEA
jgi:hypothetical protein